MKRRLLPVLLCLCMVVSLLPVTAQAAGNWTYYPKSDAEDRMAGYIEQNGLRVGVWSEEDLHIGAESPYNLVIGSNVMISAMPPY